jgi:hypothetical protein
MAKTEPLLAPKKNVGSSKASMIYTADGYFEQLAEQLQKDAPEIAEICNAMHDNGGAVNKAVVSLNEEGRSHLTNRLFPESKTPDIEGRRKDLAFLFTKLKDEEALYMWKVLTLIFCFQIVMVIGYGAALRHFGAEHWKTITVCFGVPFAWVNVQNIYVCHDVMHGATFPPCWWMRFITHPFSDFISLPWEEFVLEHNRHHASTVDLLTQGEFGWDPEMPLYWLGKPGSNQKCTDNEPGEGPNRVEFVPVKILGCIPLWLFTMWLLPVVHFFGLNDTGGAFCIEWYLHFPDSDGDKCHKDFWTRFVPRRIKHHAFVFSLWFLVYQIGQFFTGEGAWFVLSVSVCARCGYGTAWFMITNFTHSHWWNEILASDSYRAFGGFVTLVMSILLGGRHRWNEMLFHDLHHAFPNKVGTMSQRGRFHGWKKVHDAAEEVLALGLFKKTGDAETKMDKAHKKRSMMRKSVGNAQV